MKGINMRYYPDVSPGATKVIESGAYQWMRVPIDASEVGHQWVLDQWQHWAKVPTLERFTVVAPNCLELGKVSTLDEMVWGVFGDRGKVQAGNEPDWLSTIATSTVLETYPPHPPANSRYREWLRGATAAIKRCRSLPPAMGCWKGIEANIDTIFAWSACMAAMPGTNVVCANIYPWSDSDTIQNQLASMRRQIRIAKAVAQILEAQLVITEIGRVGGAPVSHLCSGVDHYVWGAGIGDRYDLPGTEPVEVKPK